MSFRLFAVMTIEGIAKAFAIYPACVHADVVLISKHHEGWCNFPNSYHWNWNSVDVGPKRDLVGDLTASVRAAGLHMGLYHSLREWYHPLYLMDNADNCSTRAFPEEVLLPTLKEMVMQYKVCVIGYALSV